MTREVAIADIDLRGFKGDEISERYAKMMANGTVFMPPILTRRYDGSYGVSDGRHRIVDAASIGKKSIRAAVVEASDF